MKMLWIKELKTNKSWHMKIEKKTTKKTIFCQNQAISMEPKDQLKLSLSEGFFSRELHKLHQL